MMDKLVCIGKNYVEHAKELGDAVPERPVLFLKPPSVLRSAGHMDEELRLRLPQGVGAVHHECEVVLRLGSGGYRLTVEQAARAIAHFSVGLDMTLRDRQAAQKKAGHPWTTSKVFPDAAVVGPWVAATELPRYADESFQLEIDGKPRQSGRIAQMSLSPAECVAYASEFFPLCEGDIVYTGTPSGVGPVVAGSRGRLRWGDIRYGVLWEQGD